MAESLWARFEFRESPSATRLESDWLSGEIKKHFPLATATPFEAVGGRDLHVWIPGVAYENFLAVLYSLVEDAPQPVEHRQLSN
ncbi:MAG: hypothetical protein ACLQNV_19560 [Steroidobacteraceae bacterium]